MSRTLRKKDQKAPLEFKNSELPWLQKGLKLLAEQGSHAFRMDRLSKEVGVAKTSFYFLFQSKDNFFLRLAWYWRSVSTANIIKEVHSRQTIHERIRSMIELIKNDRIGGLAWIQLKSLALNHSGIHSVILEAELERVNFVKGLIMEMGVSEEDAANKAKGFMYLFFGWLVLYWSNPSAHDQPEEEIKGLMEILGLPIIEL